jgi:hypothetical protein
MAKQFAYTTSSGISLPAAYGKLTNISLDALNQVAVLAFQVFASQASREQYPGIEPVLTISAEIGSDVYATYFSPSVLAGSDPYKQGYIAYDAQVGSFFVAQNASEV